MVVTLWMGWIETNCGNCFRAIFRAKPTANQVEISQLGLNERPTSQKRKPSEGTGKKKAMQRLKVLVVGDQEAEKTKMLISFIRGDRLGEDVTAVFDDYCCNLIVDGRSVELGLWDTAGEEDYDRLRPLSYPQTDVFLLCFRADKPETLEHIRTKWYPETSHYCPEAKRILVCLTGCALRNENVKPKAVSIEDCQAVAEEIHASNLMECNLSTEKGLQEVFEEAARVAMHGTTKSSSCVLQ